MTMSQAEEIKSKLDIVEVIREYVQLKPVGVNFTARCPFHREKTPSFVVSPERQIWRCFGCGKGGDVFSFVMEMEGFTFIEALRQLAPRAGVQLRSYNAQEASVRNRLLDATALAVKYYHKVLLETSEAASARAYLKQRGLNDNTIEEWEIGFSRDSWDDLLNFLKSKGFNEREIFLAGLSVKKEGGMNFFNRFRGRIMFPINDSAGNTVAFTARVSPEREATEKMGKYINSPQTQIYDKSKILFGLDRAKNAIREQGAAIIAEGQMDVISAHQAGFKNIVASSGTALSDDQVKLIKRYTSNILFSFDMDAAGQTAAERGIEQALRQEMNIKVVQIPGGKDPDECIRHNPDDFLRAVASAQDIIDYYFVKVFRGLDMNKIADKKQAAARILAVISHISNSIEKDAWLKLLAEKVGVGEQSLREALVGRRQKNIRRREDASPEQPGREHLISHEQLLSESLLSLSLKFPESISYLVGQITPDMLAEDLNRLFYKKLVIYYNNTTGTGDRRLTADSLKFWLNNNIEHESDLSKLLDLTDALILLGERDFYEIDAAAAKKEAAKIINQLKRKYLIKKMQATEQRLSDAERSHDGIKIKECMDELKFMAEEARRLNF